jgi:hypothetical protein
VLLALAVAVFLYGQGAFYWFTADRTVDSYTYTMAATALAEGENPYDTDLINARAPESIGFVFPYLYPPPLAVAMGPLVSRGPFAIHDGFVVLGVLLALVNGWLVWRIAAPRARARGWLVLMLGFLAVTGPVVSSIRLGQINSVVVFLVLVALLAETRNRSWIAGGALACAILLKLTPFVFVAGLVFRARWRTLLATTVSAAVIVGGSIVAAGTDVWSHYIERMLTPLPFSPPMSLRGLSEWAGEQLGFPDSVATTLALVVITAAVAWMVRCLPRLRDTESTWSFLALFSLLVSPLTWHHHYYLALLPYGVGLVQRVDEGAPSRAVWLWAGLAVATLLRYPGVLSPIKPIASFVALFAF